MDSALSRIRSIADYQFGKNTGDKLFPKNVKISYSKRTGKIRYIYFDNHRLATLRPKDGLLSLSIFGAKQIAKKKDFLRCFVTIRSDVSKFIAQGGDAFAVHVTKADYEIRPKDEVVVVDEKGKVLAVGRAVLSGEEMSAFKTNVAVKIRHGTEES